MKFNFRTTTLGLAYLCAGTFSVCSLPSYAMRAVAMRPAPHVSVNRAPVSSHVMQHTMPHNDIQRGLHTGGVSNFHGGAGRNFNNGPRIENFKGQNMARRDNWQGTAGRSSDHNQRIDNFRRDDMARRDGLDHMRGREFDRRPETHDFRHDELTRGQDSDRMHGRDFDRHNELASRNDFANRRGHSFDRNPRGDNFRRDDNGQSVSNSSTAPNGAFGNRTTAYQPPGRNAVTTNNSPNPLAQDTGIHSGSYFKIGQ